MKSNGQYSDLAQRILNYSIYSQQHGKIGLIQNQTYQEEPHPVLRETLEHHILDDPAHLKQAVIQSIKAHHIDNKVEQSLLLYGSFGVANEAPTERSGNQREYLTKLFDHFQIPYSLEQAESYTDKGDEVKIDFENLPSRE